MVGITISLKNRLKVDITVSLKIRFLNINLIRKRIIGFFGVLINESSKP
jgi:hypothetical protein